jgi:hypothetical protein
LTIIAYGVTISKIKQRKPILLLNEREFYYPVGIEGYIVDYFYLLTMHASNLFMVSLPVPIVFSGKSFPKS